MKVEASESFFESLERLTWYDTKLWKAWEFIRRTLPRFFKNIWRFRKELASHEWWDYRFNLEMLYRSLSITFDGMSTKGWEVRETREPKVKAIARALELLKHKLDDDYIQRAEVELGELSRNPIRFEPIEGKEELYSMVDDDTPAEKKHARKVYKRARVIEEKEWKELWDIFKGTKFSKMYGEEYDGTDLRGWWD
jgi:hypothetical protein